MKSTPEWQARHRAYLLTKHWKKLRAAAVKRDNGKCVECGETETLQVHHKIYRKRFEDGKLKDVVTLCNICHRIAHGRVVYFPFDYKVKELHQQITRYENLPTAEQERELVSMILCKDHEDETCALFRSKAGMRIILTSSKMWDLWLKTNRDVTIRLWPWARKKLRKIQKQIGRKNLCFYSK